jgi:myo-inositol-1(or 4)-monophosphatase
MNHEHPDRYVVTGKSFTAVAVNTASRAGEWIKSRLGHTLDIRQKTTSHDLVTEVDKGAETLIRNLIHTYFPTHAFLGEEGAEPGALGAQRAIEKIKDEPYVWIVDPIDGTTNFIHGFPFFSISIALAYHGDIIVGVVYDPIHDELFVAEKSKGAYLRGKRIHVSSEAKLADSLLGTGFPADRDQMLPLLLSQISTVAPKVRNLRANGSAALHLAYVASGRLSGFWEPNLNAWDVAAGMLLVQEAGGHVTGMRGEPYHLHTRDIVATNERIHDEIIRLLN